MIADILDFKGEVGAKGVRDAKVVVDDIRNLEIRVHGHEVARGGVMAARLAGIGQAVAALCSGNREYRRLTGRARSCVSRT